jgi:vancomycin resistance protein VanJ
MFMAQLNGDNPGPKSSGPVAVPSPFEDPRRLLLKLLPAIRLCLKWATLCYLVLLTVVLIAMEWFGEKNLVLSVLLFLPPQGFLLPLVVITPLSFLFQRKLCRWQLGAVGLVSFGYMHWHWSWPVTAHGESLTLLTDNIGDRKLGTLQPFLESEQPDLIAYQDAFKLAGPLRKQSPGRFVTNHNEFVLISKFPIKSSGMVPEMVFHKRPLAAWFEVDYHGQSIIIYSVHMPTPRKYFSKLRGRGFLAEAIGGRGIYSGEVLDDYESFWQERIRLAKVLIALLAGEKRPFLVVGDFNMPDHGYLFHLFKPHLTDAFATVGSGYGLTFPGNSFNPLTLFGPWLRLDYIFTGKDWHPLSCHVEPSRNPQHRAVVAKLELNVAN